MDPSTSPIETTPIDTIPTEPTRRPRRARRALAIAAGVVLVPALYAASGAATGGGGNSPTAVPAARHSDGATGTELETEHGAIEVQPHGGATTPSVPEVTTPTPTTPGQEVEHPVPEPGDDQGVDAPGEDVGDDNGNDGGVATPAPPTTQSFSSAGGSITVTVTDGVVSLASSAPAAGFTAEVHDNGPTRVEVRFFSGQGEWRIRIDLAGGGLTSEITQHG